MTPAETIAQYRKDVTPDLYDVARYIAWPSIDEYIHNAQRAIQYLDTNRSGLTIDALAEGLRTEPTLYGVLMTLLAIPRGAGFSDGRELPDPATPLKGNHRDTAQLLLDVGVDKLLHTTADVAALLRIGLTAQDSLRRRYRVEANIGNRILSILNDAIGHANATGSAVFDRVNPREWPPSCRGKVNYVISINGLARIAIDSVFQTATGGRQLRDLSINYPRLQQEIADSGLSLILIADGRGIREASDEILARLFAGVASCLTLRQAAAGGLARDFLRLSESTAPSVQSRSLRVLIETGLSSSGALAASDLPVPVDQARLALAEYLDHNRELDLVLQPGGVGMTWRRRQLVADAFALQHRFEPTAALNNFAEALGGAIPEHFSTDSLQAAILELPSSNPVIPSRLLVTSVATMPSRETLQKVSTLALSKVPDAKMSVVLCPDPPDEQTATTWRRVQETMATNVIVLDATRLLDLARSTQPGPKLLAIELLKQSDLVKSSPFVLNSVTPQGMFYGRETEEATMLSTLKTNSIALVGGRRIGKTSLMRHTEDRLKEAGFITYFGDCQTVRDWEGFAKMASRWGVAIRETFEPSQLIDLVVQLKPESDAKLVVLLDEIDQLLDWDSSHSQAEVPEAFFRACRTLSQEGHAQFVFSGERTISDRLWDAQSPHWNFTRPLQLRQLDESAAQKLLFSPLQALQITISEQSSFAGIAWSRTSGHPQLLQTLGDRLIRTLNDRPPSLRSNLSPADLVDVADNYNYAEHYLETYWGQATILERLITLLIARGLSSVNAIRTFLTTNGISRTDADLRAALRMLHLYGVTNPTEIGYELRLDWFKSAIAFYGSIDELGQQYMAQLQ